MRVAKPIQDGIAFLQQFQHMPENIKGLHYAKWRERFQEEEFPLILSENKLSGTEKNKLILSPFRSENHPSFSISFDVENPARGFLFYDFATQQKGAGTVAFRRIQQGLEVMSNDDFLLQIALQRGYDYYPNTSDDKLYIDVVARYRERNVKWLALLKEKGILKTSAPTLDNVFAPIIRIDKDLLLSQMESLTQTLLSDFEDEKDYRLTEKNKNMLIDAKFSHIRHIEFLMANLPDEPLVGVWEWQQDKAVLVNLLHQGILLLDYHRFDKEIPVCLNFQLLSHLGDMTCFERERFKPKPRLRITLSIGQAQKWLEECPVLLLPQQYYQNGTRYNLTLEEMRNAAFLAMRYAEDFIIDSNTQLFGVMLNQIGPSHIVTCENESALSHFFNEKAVDMVLYWMEIDEEITIKRQADYLNAVTTFDKQRLGSLSARPKSYDKYRTMLYRILNELVLAEKEGKTIQDVIQFFKEEGQWTVQNIPTVAQPNNDEFMEEDLMGVQNTEIQNRLKLNNYLAEIMRHTQGEHLDGFVENREIQGNQFGVCEGNLNIFHKALAHFEYHPMYFNDSQGLKRTLDSKIVFPIRNSYGDVIAFGARELDETVKPKYINSLACPINVQGKIYELFDKKSVWYGIFEAKEAIANENSVYVVEGYMDCITAHQVGLKNTVASMGTAVSKEKIDLMLEYVEQMVFMLDGDLAGLEGMLNVAEHWKSDKPCYFIVLPQNQDPADRKQHLLNDVKVGFDRQNFLKYAYHEFVFNTSKKQLVSDDVREKRENNLFYYAKWLSLI